MSEENKISDIERIMGDTPERREARKKRRIRSQVMAYSVVIGLIIVLAGGIVFGIQAIQAHAKDRQEKQSQQQSAVDDLLSTEDEITMEPSSDEPVPEGSEAGQTEVVTELTFEEKLDQVVNAAIEVMPLEDKVAGLFMVTPDGLTGVNNVRKAGDTTREALAKYAVGGLIYHSNNVKNEETFKEMLSNTVLYSKYPVFLAVEEEGGDTTQLVKAKLGEKTDSLKKIAESGDVNNAYQTGATIGSYMKELGLNMNLAPAADLASVEKSVMKDRSFGDDPQMVTEYVLSMVKGMTEQGITPCVKHFPGLGSVTADTEKGIAVTERTIEEFDQNEFQVFRKLVTEKVPVIMVGNLSIPALTEDNTPACLAPQIVTDILRKDMEYDGLIITDALNEKAISEYYAADEAAIMALKAGCDMIVCPEDFEKAYEGVLNAVKEGTISEERINDALRRIYRIKFVDRVEQTQADPTASADGNDDAANTDAAVSAEGTAGDGAAEGTTGGGTADQNGNANADEADPAGDTNAAEAANAAGDAENAGNDEDGGNAGNAEE